MEAQRNEVRTKIEELAKKIRPTVERIQILERHVASIDETLSKVFPVTGASRAPRSSDGDSEGDSDNDYTAIAVQWLEGLKEPKCTEKDFSRFLESQGKHASRNSVRNVFRNLKDAKQVIVHPGDLGSGRRATLYTIIPAQFRELEEDELSVLF